MGKAPTFSDQKSSDRSVARLRVFRDGLRTESSVRKDFDVSQRELSNSQWTVTFKARGWAPVSFYKTWEKISFNKVSFNQHFNVAGTEIYFIEKRTRQKNRSTSRPSPDSNSHRHLFLFIKYVGLGEELLGSTCPYYHRWGFPLLEVSN